MAWNISKQCGEQKQKSPASLSAHIEFMFLCSLRTCTFHVFDLYHALQNGGLLIVGGRGFAPVRAMVAMRPAVVSASVEHGRSCEALRNRSKTKHPPVV